MTHEDTIQKAVDTWIEMERKAKAWDLMRSEDSLRDRGGDRDAFARVKRMDQHMQRILDMEKQQ